MENKNYTVTMRDGKIVELIVGNKVKAMRDIVKAQGMSYWRLYSDSQVAVNPFSGVEVVLDPLEYSIYHFCVEWYRRYERGGVDGAGCPIQTYDSMKYLLLDINANAYYDLLD